jgi:hypothetical protein
MLGTGFSAIAVVPYAGGALIATCFCWISVALYFFRRYAVSALVAFLTVLFLLVYKIVVIGM